MLWHSVCAIDYFSPSTGARTIELEYLQKQTFDVYRDDRDRHELPKMSVDARLVHRSVLKTPSKFDADHSQGFSLMKTNLDSHMNSHPVNLDLCRKGLTGRKKIEIHEVNRKIQKVPFSSKKKIRSKASAQHIPKTTLRGHLENLGIKFHHYKLRQYVTEDNKKRRLNGQWNRPSLWNDRKPFDSFEDVVHIGEKWCYVCKMNNKCYYLIAKMSQTVLFNTRAIVKKSCS